MSTPHPQLPGYRVIDLIGRGGFGVVYRAVQEAVDREVAVKVDSRMMLDESDRRRFLREARAVGRLSGHPHVVDLYDAGVLPDGRPYLIMELCTGSLARRLNETGPLPPAQACELGVKIADALVAAHEAGVLHRDIKPANILINRYGVYGLADFGLAALAEPGRDSSASLAALTPPYAAPEAFRQEPPSERSDIYSLGATIYALLAGRPPRFPPTGDLNLTEIIQRHDQPVPDIPGVPAAATAVLAQALAADPAQRYESAAEFRDALAALDITSDPEATQAPAAEDPLGDAPTSLIGADAMTGSVRFGPQRDDSTTLGRVEDLGLLLPLASSSDDQLTESPVTPGGHVKRLLNVKRLFNNVGRGVTALVSVVVLTVVGVAWAVLANLERDIGTTDILNVPGSPDANDGATDILLVGSDSRTDANGQLLPENVLKLLRTEESAGVNTDTIILIRVPDDGSRAIAMSIPRDAYVPIPNAEPGLINTAFGVGKQQAQARLRDGGDIDEQRLVRESDQAGRRVLVQVVQQLTGVRVDHYAELNLYGFYLLTEAIGGVEVCLKGDAVDPDSGSNFKAGRHVIVGGDALSFVRQRHGLPRGDLDRIVRQQVFMAAVANKVLSTGVLTDPGTISELGDAVRRTAVIDAGWDVLEFAEQLRELAAGNLEFVTIPVVDTNRSEDGESVVAVNEAQVRAFAAGLLDGSTRPSESTRPSTSAPSIAAADPDAPITADSITCVS